MRQMRYLYYTNYQSGNCGLSNSIMSIEIGVILAHLTNRFLVLDGNVSPIGNIVAYDGRVDNSRPSRVTDLIDIPVPWAEPDAVDLEGLQSLELADLSLEQCAFYFPKTLDLSSRDAMDFARGRDHWLTVTDEYDRVPVLRLSEDPLVPGTQQHRRNLCFYSYQFYLNEELRCSVYRLLQRMRAKPPFAELAKRVAGDIGPFNAIHLRRGDFKRTYGVTALNRTIGEMDQVFRREEPLVILTDERDDPFFDEIKLAYPNHYFIDWHILDHYGSEFARLPQTDSLSLAYLSQLVAAESKAFIGTMMSTFTALIQRSRANRGKHEPFRFLLNELPEPGQELERGRHAISDYIPLEDGVMVEESGGAYTWNRVSQWLNPAWMREWPESFLTPVALATGELPTGRADTLEPPARGRAAPLTLNQRASSAGGVMAEPRDIRLHISLKGGQEHVATLREDAPELLALFTALASPEAGDRFVQLPLDQGAAACSLRTSQIASIVSEPPVVVNTPELPEPRHGAGHAWLFRPRHVIIDDFLSSREHDELLAFALVSEAQFRAGTVLTNEPEYRQNLVIMNFGETAHSRLLQNRLLIWFPLLAQTFDEPVFPLAAVESQLTAAGERQFYKVHCDDGPEIPSRVFSCVYYLYREPRGFAGGSLRLYDSIEENGSRRPADTYIEVDPRPNRLVVFPSRAFHEAMPVRCPSGEFVDYRFAVTNWLHRGEKPSPEATFGWGHFHCGVVSPQFASGDSGGEQGS